MTTPAFPSPCCGEFAQVSRRGLFRGAALAGATTVVGSAVVTMSAPAYADLATSGSPLVILSLRGAADGLSLVVPHGDPAYYAARPRIAVPKAQLVGADSFFGFHPKLAPLMPLWTAGKLAAIHATGLPQPNRSHFSAMEEVEDADPGSSARQGWLNRLLATDDNRSPLQGIVIGSGAPPTSMYGGHRYMAFGEVDDTLVAGVDQWDAGERMKSLHTLWGTGETPMAVGARSALQATKGLDAVRATSATPANGAKYPATDLGRALATVARTLKGDVGTRVITVDQGDWDMHSGLGNLEWGDMIRNAADLGQAIAAFFQDLGNLGNKVTLVTISEFGRRVAENSNMGLDHGHGNVMLVAGAGVKGGKFYGNWPGLQNTLDADLPVTTDYRAVLAEIVAKRFDVDATKVFPGFQRADVGFMA